MIWPLVNLAASFILCACCRVRQVWNCIVTKGGNTWAKEVRFLCVQEVPGAYIWIGQCLRPHIVHCLAMDTEMKIDPYKIGANFYYKEWTTSSQFKPYHGMVKWLLKEKGETFGSLASTAIGKLVIIVQEPRTGSEGKAGSHQLQELLSRDQRLDQLGQAWWWWAYSLYTDAPTSREQSSSSFTLPQCMTLAGVLSTRPFCSQLTNQPA